MFIAQYILFFICLLTVFSLVSLLIVKHQKFQRSIESKTPFISILIAVRNEEENLPFLFDALTKLDYPKEKYEIIFGNDYSTDDSRNLIDEYTRKNKNAVLIDVSLSANQIAKANVLMQLAQQATGEYLYFTDADMRPPRDLLYRYQSFFDEKMAGITGVTLPLGKKTFQVFQRIDWVYALAMVSKAQALGYQTTAMGNNMMLRKKDYDEIGGYESLPISVVEDFTLYRAIVEQKREFPVVFDASLLSFTEPISNIFDLLKQRKRWMSGGLILHWFLKSVMLFQGLFYPSIFLLCWFNPFIGWSLWFVKTTIQAIFIHHSLKKIGRKEALWNLYGFEIYSSIFSSLLLVFYLLPIKINWKNRKYGNH